MSELASIQYFIKNKKTLSSIIKSLDSFIIGHRASMEVLDNPDDFFKRIESYKNNHLRNLLITIIGEKALDNLDSTKRAIIGLEPFPR